MTPRPPQPSAVASTGRHAGTWPDAGRTCSTRPDDRDHGDRGEPEAGPPEGTGEPPPRGQGLRAEADPVEQQGAADDEDHHREVPQVDAHHPGPEPDRDGPRTVPCEPAGEGRLEGQDDPGLQQPEEAERDAGRERVVHRGTVEADHRDRVRAQGDERDEAGAADRRHPESTCGAVEPPVQPRVAELVDRAPHHHVVGEADPPRPGRQAHEVDQAAEQQPARDAGPAEALPEPQRDRGQCAHDDVRGEEPRGDQCHLRGGAQGAPVHPGRVGHGEDRRPTRGAAGRPARAAAGAAPRNHTGQVAPRSRDRLQDTAFAYPPTRKNTGITWKTHVSGCVHGARSSTAPVASVPSWTVTAATSQ